MLSRLRRGLECRKTLSRTGFPTNKQTNEERDNKVGWFSYPLSLFKNYFSTISKKKTGRSIEFLGFSATRSRVPIFPISNHRRTSINPLPPPRKQAQFRRAVLSAKVGSRGCGATWNSLCLWRREAGGRERNEGPILVGNDLSCSFKSLKLECKNKKKKTNKQVGGNNMFKMLWDTNFTYDSSMPIYENRPPSWPYTLDYKLFHDCMIPPCPTRSYPGLWEVPMVMWQDLNGGRCSMGDACSNPPTADGVYKMLIKNFERHYTTNRWVVRFISINRDGEDGFEQDNNNNNINFSERRSDCSITPHGSLSPITKKVSFHSWTR